LSNRAAMALSDGDTFLEFQRWLGRNNSCVFTMNSFASGQFHGTRVKEAVFLPDWSSPERLAYTNLLFDLLARLAERGLAGETQTAYPPQIS
jgi:hypothetical protein